MYNLRKSYSDFQGVDLTSTDLARPDELSSEMKNTEYKRDGHLSKRRGHQKKASDVTGSGMGLIKYRRVNPTSRVVEDELLVLADSLYRVKDTTLTVTYAGAAVAVTADLYYDSTTSNFRFTVTADGASLMNQALGVGYDEASPYTVANLATAINAVTGLTATTSGTTTVPAAFLDVTNSYNLKAASLAVVANYVEAVNQDSEITEEDLQYKNHVIHQDHERFENPSFLQLHGCLYFAGERPLKYDGQTFCAMGQPEAFNIGPFGNAVAGSGLTVGDYYYRVRLKMVDNVGNVIFGPLTTPEVPGDKTTTAGGNLNIELPRVTNGYNFRFARITSTDSGPSLTVDSGHTLQVGDRVYASINNNTDTTSYEYFITAKTATTITIAPANADANEFASFATDTIFSTCRFELYRTQAGGSTFYYVGEYACAEISDKLIDSLPDAAIVANGQLEEPAYSPEPPPPCQYITKFQNTIVLAGAPFFYSETQSSLTVERNPNTFYWADVEFIEGFPSDGSHQADVEAEDDYITGARAFSESLFLFQNRGLTRVTGELGTGNILVERLKGDIGTVAHATIQELNDKLIFLSERGVASMEGGALPSADIGQNIRGAFEEVPTSSSTTLQTKRAIGFVDKTDEKYFLYVPCEGGSGTETENWTAVSLGDGGGSNGSFTKTYANTNSRIFVYDGLKPRWLEWDALNMAGGIAFHDNALWWLERRYSTFSSAVKYRLCKRLQTNHARDYEDHNAAIVWSDATSWYTETAPSVEKQYLRLQVNSIYKTPGNDFDLDIEQEVNFIDSVKATMTLDMANSATLGAKGITKLADGKFCASRFRFKNSAHNTNVDIEGWEIEFALPFKPRLKP